MALQTIILVSAWALLTTSETISNSILAVLMRGREYLHFIPEWQSSLKCYENIVIALFLMAVLRVLHINQREK